MNPNYKPETYKADDGKFYWRLRTTHDNQVVQVSDAFKTKAAAEKAAAEAGHDETMFTPA